MRSLVLAVAGLALFSALVGAEESSAPEPSSPPADGGSAEPQPSSAPQASSDPAPSSEPEPSSEPQAPDAPAQTVIDADLDASDGDVSAGAVVGADTDAATESEAASAAAAADAAAPDEVAGIEIPSFLALLQSHSESQATASAGAESQEDGGAVAFLGMDIEDATAEVPGVGAPSVGAPSMIHLRVLPPSGLDGSAPDAGPEEAPSTQASLEAAAVAADGLPAVALPVALGVMALAATAVVAGASLTGSGSAALVGAKKFLLRILPLGGLGLFSRLSGDELLHHPKRNDIVEFVRQNPGERVEVVRRALGVTNGTMLHHLRILEQGDLVRVHRDDGMARVYPAGPRVVPTTYLIPLRRQMLDALRVAPGITQREIAASMGLSERVVSYHVGWLSQHGLLAVQREGSYKRCFPAAPAPGAGPELAAA